ncbi:16 kDa phloem protein 1 [Cucurbita maxima]|uniref:16 kDa phloem protein 1 n=3 Tax=Cucurbita TaxID=3660 RepID=Q4JHJ0_CUCMA|nr:16 kDa phloem protein 1 [Cucurbita maxima]AAY96409.1 16 kDa. phloem protein 1 [Cucurbita maxima]AAY96412.1 16 kDa. phloem protein 1 [Cucurbita maxima x Cucurbita moschata]ABK41006.1 16 kDa phloem protein 1 [Cucurbita moschata]
MGMGMMEVHLISGKGLQAHDPLNKPIDPYAEINFKGQERMSKVAKNAGPNPLWDEKFKFLAEYPGSGGDFHILFKVMDHDAIDGDDYIGDVKIDVKNLLAEGVRKGKSEMPPRMYHVLAHKIHFKGEIEVGVSFKLQGGGGCGGCNPWEN